MEEKGSRERHGGADRGGVVSLLEKGFFISSGEGLGSGVWPGKRKGDLLLVCLFIWEVLESAF